MLCSAEFNCLSEGLSTSYTGLSSSSFSVKYFTGCISYLKPDFTMNICSDIFSDVKFWVSIKRILTLSLYYFESSSRYGTE